MKMQKFVVIICWSFIGDLESNLSALDYREVSIFSVFIIVCELKKDWIVPLARFGFLEIYFI